MSRRHLVAVSWCIPPALFPRSIQVARLLKGLSRLGWTNTVVTPSVECLAAADPIDRALSDSYSGYYRLAPVDLKRVDLEPPSWLERWTHGPSNDDALTDDEIWVKRASRAVRQLSGWRGANVLATFAQPWRDHLVGLELRRSRRRLPWVAHFSDPWVDSPYLADWPEGQKRQEGAQEAQVIEHADAVVFTNRYAADLVMEKYPVEWRKKVRVLPHATDADLLPAADRLTAPPRTGDRPLRLSYVGNLFIGRRTAHGLLEAVAQLKTRRPLDGCFELVFVGEGSGLAEAQEKATSLGLDTIVTFRRRLSHLESLAAMRDSDALVLIDAPAETNVFLPSKLADYLMVDRPIVALTPHVGPSAEIARHLGYPVIEPEDVSAITEALEHLAQRHSARTLGPSATAAAIAERFSVDATARAFVGIINDAIRNARGRRGWFPRAKRSS